MFNMLKRSSKTSNRNITLLAGYYSIKGDGVAHAKIDRVVQSKRFADSVAKLSAANLNHAEKAAAN